MVELRALQVVIAVAVIIVLLGKSACSDDRFHVVQFDVAGEKKVEHGQTLIFICYREGSSGKKMDVYDIENGRKVDHMKNSAYLSQGCDLGNVSQPCFKFVSVQVTSDMNGKRYQCRIFEGRDIVNRSAEITITGE